MIYRIAFSLFSLLSLWSCSGGDTVEPMDLEGAWVLKSVSIDIKLVDEERVEEMADFTDLNSQLVFNSDGTFNSNIDIRNDLVAGIIPAEAGTYRIVNKRFLELITSPEGNQQVTKFGISIGGNEMTFEFTKDLYRELIEGAAAAQGVLDEAAVQEFLDASIANIEYFNVTYTFVGT